MGFFKTVGNIAKNAKKSYDESQDRAFSNMERKTVLMERKAILMKRQTKARDMMEVTKPKRNLIIGYSEEPKANQKKWKMGL